mgnify:CR=1 FL=1
MGVVGGWGSGGVSGRAWEEVVAGGREAGMEEVGGREVCVCVAPVGGAQLDDAPQLTADQKQFHILSRNEKRKNTNALY